MIIPLAIVLGICAIYLTVWIASLAAIVRLAGWRAFTEFDTHPAVVVLLAPYLALVLMWIRQLIDCVPSDFEEVGEA